MPGAGRREAIDGGELSVMVCAASRCPDSSPRPVRALLGISRGDDMVRLDDVQILKVDSPRSHLTLAIDGETLALAPPLEFPIRPQALTVIAPAQAALGKA